MEDLSKDTMVCRNIRQNKDLILNFKATNKPNKEIYDSVREAKAKQE